MNLSQGNTPDATFRQSTSFCRLSFFCSILLPYIPFSMRQPLLLFTKFLELKECMNCNRQRFDFGSSEPPDTADVVSDIFAKLSPFLSEQERTQFSQMQNMMQMLKLYQTFQELAPFMNMGGDAAPEPASDAPQEAAEFSGFSKEEFHSSESNNAFKENKIPEENNTSDFGNASDENNTSDRNNAADSSMTNMLFSMLSPEQKEMFENLKSVMSEEHSE